MPNLELAFLSDSAAVCHLMTSPVHSRRDFMALSSGLLGSGVQAGPPARALATNRLFGVNLTNKVRADRRTKYLQSEVDCVSDLGFNFVRLPLDYRCWLPFGVDGQVDQRELGEIEEAVGACVKRNLHVNVALHRAPGYCVNPPVEQPSLWLHEGQQHAFLAIWKNFAKRFSNYGAHQVSFNLINEPNANVPEQMYLRVMRAARDAIWSESPRRPVFVDGMKWGQFPPSAGNLEDVVWSTRGYWPMQLSHFGTPWLASEMRIPRAEWPLHIDGTLIDGTALRQRTSSWNLGSQVHVGEWGVYSSVPHRVALAYMADWLHIWRQREWGWALWQLRGKFGLLDSERADASYVNAGPYRLDISMYRLLRGFVA